MGLPSWHHDGNHCLPETQGINVDVGANTTHCTAFLLPLLHLHDLVSVEAPHLELPVEVPHRERNQVLVCDPALQRGIRE